ncbi:MAG: hypothetical protein K2G37_04225 [Clostridia bacterium]|nr:hypothetical protein [Clostridia bacterium]MDE7329138.1 hypothetical protein [Clostridia bacterium]
MKSIAVYILGITFLSLLILGISCQVKVPDGAVEMQVYARSLPIADNCEYVDEMCNFNIYHYNETVGIKDERLDNTLGVAYIYPKESAEVDDLIDKFSAKIYYSQDLEDGITYYGYCKNLGKSVEIDGKEINIQIVSNKDNIIVGFPLIMGSY